MEDSAAYYLEKGKELRKKKDLAMYSDLSKISSDKGVVSNIKIHIEQLKQKEALGKQQIYKRNMYVVVLMIVWVVVIIWAAYKIRKLHAHHQAERDMLVQKGREIKSLQSELDKLSPDTIHLFDKIKQIISDFCAKNHSDLKMEEADWLQLQRVMDNRWSGAIGRIQNEYLLSDTEIRLLCLHLTDIPTSNLSFLFDRSRDFVYSNTRGLFVKLGLERGKGTYKKALENFIENQG